MQQATYHRSNAAANVKLKRRRNRCFRRLAVYLVVLVTVVFSTNRLLSGVLVADESLLARPAASESAASSDEALFELAAADRTARDMHMISAVTPEPYRALVVEAANEFQLSPILVAAQASVENSAWNPTMRGSAGEVGLLQILPSTQQEVVNLNLVERCSLEEPRCNLRTGAAYLAEAIRREGGDLRRGLRYYNGGPSWANKHATAEYADAVLSRMAAVTEEWYRQQMVSDLIVEAN